MKTLAIVAILVACSLGSSVASAKRPVRPQVCTHQVFLGGSTYTCK
jgi:hypothetical protein